MPRPWPDKVKDRAVELWLGGAKYADITRITAQESEDGRGVPQATVIFWLQERGIKRDRLQKHNDEPVTVDQALLRLAAAERRVGQLEAENAVLRAALSGEPNP